MVFFLKHVCLLISENPQEPQRLRIVEVGEGSVSLEWDSPEFDGNSPIKRYIIELKNGVDASYKLADRVDGGTLGATVSDLKENRTYFFRVFAENKLGKSKCAAEIADGVLIKPGKSKLLLKMNEYTTKSYLNILSLGIHHCT